MDLVLLVVVALGVAVVLVLVLNALVVVESLAVLAGDLAVLVIVRLVGVDGEGGGLDRGSQCTGE